MERISNFFFPRGKNHYLKTLYLFKRDDPICAVDPQHAFGPRLCFFAHDGTTNSDLGVPHKGIQFAFQLGLLLLHRTLHTTQPGKHGLNLAPGRMHLIL